MVTNFESAFHMCQLAHPLFKASGNGSIVFISFIARVVAINSGAIYQGSKYRISELYQMGVFHNIGDTRTYRAFISDTIYNEILITKS